MMQFTFKEVSMSGFERIGEFLREARKKANLSQGALAEELGYSNAQFVSNIERGIANLPIDKVGKAAKVLGTDKACLLAEVISSAYPIIRDSQIRLYCMNTGEMFSVEGEDLERLRDYCRQPKSLELGS